MEFWYGIKVAIVYHDMYVDTCNEFSVEKNANIDLHCFTFHKILQTSQSCRGKECVQVLNEL